MAYRRRQGNAKSFTFEDSRSGQEPPSPSPTAEENPSPIAAQAIRASSAHRDSSISSAYGESTIASAYKDLPDRRRSSVSPRDSGAFDTSMKNVNESKYGFWGVLARKAKSLIDDDNASQRFENSGRKQPGTFDSRTGGQFPQSYQSPEGLQQAEAQPTQRSPDSIASSLNHIGGTIKNKIEEGLTIMENKTAGIIQETRKINIRRKGSGPGQNQASYTSAQHNFSPVHTDHETQLKASRDVANAMAAKAKLLLRELKTVKADLAFAKERCAQLEEENKMLREGHEKGGGPEDDDLIRLQLETLLAEKGRLAHENSVYARENRFLREIVEYHQLTMQDVVYVDEGIEEVSEVFSNSPHQTLSRTNSLSNSSLGASSPALPTTKPPAIVVPEACPIVPTAPSPHVTSVVISPDPRASSKLLAEREDENEQL
ncbi:uncharacterized protein A4U43_C07F7430 [Asparagus officinalis]|uniref:Uncharacterized protein n=1 Tax=Asparagus officinalis TaxID=4686 RepID=A0A5P1EAE5_ASPOF|nr:uncharacterized protein LOC109849081 [Asparagus officinalis]ONK62723.1 uncharacterized protein A4U43_C07F7430 [Asparagus officinalis]